MRSKNLYAIEDMGSTNGVKFKGKRIRDSRAKLKLDQTFSVGRNVFRVTNKPPALVADAIIGTDESMHDATMIDSTATQSLKEKNKGARGFFSFLRRDK